MVCSCWQRIRNSTYLIILLVFCSLLTDNLLLTLVDPILPDILLHVDGTSNLLEGGNNTASNSTSYTASNDTSSGPISQTINSNGRYGFLVAAKGGAQFLCNPFVGTIVTWFGYRKPMIVGSFLLMASTTAFAFGASYVMLFVTRLIQGAASSVTAVTGMGLLAATFTDEDERGKAMGIGIGGLSLGITIGPVYGSVLYELWGQAVPFLVLAGMVLFSIGLMLLAYKPDTHGSKGDHSLMSICQLLADPYILIVAGNMFLLNLDVSVILAFLPMRLIDLQNPPTWQLGIVVLPTSIGYLVATLIFPRITRFLKRWLCGLLGLIISTASLVLLAFCTTFVQMLITTSFLGISLGMVSTSMQPIFGHLVDIRHSSVYGNVYAISDMSVCLAMTIGPLIGGPVVYELGFQWLVFGAAAFNLVFAPLCILLRNPPAKNKKEEIEPLLAERSGSSGYLTEKDIEYKEDANGNSMPYFKDFFSSTEISTKRKVDQRAYDTV